MAVERQPREARYVREWVEQEWPEQSARRNVRLGALESGLAGESLSAAEMRANGVFRRYADAVVIDLEGVHIIEGKLHQRAGAIEQLTLYARLFPLTPEFSEFRDLPIIKHLVWAVRDTVIESLAREQGIRVHFFAPPWVRDYLGEIAARKTSNPRTGGLEPGT